MTNVNVATAYWESVQVGDPVPPWEEADGGRCWAIDPEEGYACGRPQNHAGQHVAPTVRHIVATWRTS